MQQRPDPHGHHDDLDPEQVAELDLLVPDDPGELLTPTGPARPDVVPPASRAAAPGEARGPVGRGPTGEDAWPPGGAIPFSRQRRLALTAFVVAAAVLAAGVSGLIGATVFPGGQSVATGAALAQPATPPGTVGGLLVSTDLEGLGTVPSLALRPTVLVLVPTSCDGCAATLVQLQHVADTAGVRLTLVGRSGQEEQLTSLSDLVGGSGRTVLLDRDGALMTAYQADEAPGDLTVVMVRADGVVVQVNHNPSFDPPTVQDAEALVSVPPSA
jgi:hypothetical protein